MSRQLTGYLDKRGDPIRDGDILCEPVDFYEDIAYWRVFFDQHLDNWFAYGDKCILPLRELAPYVWLK